MRVHELSRGREDADEKSGSRNENTRREAGESECKQVYTEEDPSPAADGDVPSHNVIREEQDMEACS